MNHFTLCFVGRNLMRLFGIVMIVFMIAPLLAVVPISFSSGTFLSYPLPGLSLRWYEKVFSAGPWLQALRNSLLVGCAATLLATLLGTLAALAFARRAWDEREPTFILHARHFPEFRTMHSDPRFGTILNEMNEPC